MSWTWCILISPLSIQIYYHSSFFHIIVFDLHSYFLVILESRIFMSILLMKCKRDILLMPPVYLWGIGNNTSGKRFLTTSLCYNCVKLNKYQITFSCVLLCSFGPMNDPLPLNFSITFFFLLISQIKLQMVKDSPLFRAFHLLWHWFWVIAKL